MKTPITILLLLLSTTIFAQTLTPKEELDRMFYKEGVSTTALVNYISTHSTSPYRLVAMLSLAQIFDKCNLIDSSELLYKQALSMPDSVDKYSYRHYSAMRLTEISLAKKNYSTALNYLDQAYREFPPRYNCGTVLIEVKRKIFELYWGCYIGQGNYRQAIEMFAPIMLYYYEVFGDVNKLYEAFTRIYSKEDIKKEFLGIEKNIELKKIENEGSGLQAISKVFGIEIKIKWYNDETLTEQQQKQKSMERIKELRIYKLATQSS